MTRDLVPEAAAEAVYESMHGLYRPWSRLERKKKNGWIKAVEAALPALEKHFAERLKEVERQREDWSQKAHERTGWGREWRARAEKAEAALADRDRQVRALSKALAVAVLAGFYDDALPEDLYADPFEAEGLLKTTRDACDEYITNITPEGVQFLHDVLTRSLTQPEADPEVPRCGEQIVLNDQGVVNFINGGYPCEGVMNRVRGAAEDLSDTGQPVELILRQVDCQPTPELLGEEVVKAFKLLALHWYDGYEDGLTEEDFGAGQFAAEGLYVHDVRGVDGLSKKGEKFVREVLVRLVSNSTQPVSESPGDSVAGAEFSCEGIEDRYVADAKERLEAEGVCMKPPAGWRCTRPAGHDGPCAALPATQPVPGNSGGVEEGRSVDLSSGYAREVAIAAIRDATEGIFTAEEVADAVLTALLTGVGR